MKVGGASVFQTVAWVLAVRKQWLEEVEGASSFGDSALERCDGFVQSEYVSERTTEMVGCMNFRRTSTQISVLEVVIGFETEGSVFPLKAGREHVKEMLKCMFPKQFKTLKLKTPSRRSWRGAHSQLWPEWCNALPTAVIR